MLRRALLLTAFAAPLMLAACGGSSPGTSPAADSSAVPSESGSASVTPSPSASPSASESPTAGLLPVPVTDWSQVAGREFVDGSGTRLAFTEQGIGSTVGCNSMGGGAQIEDSRLIIVDGALAQTEMACDDELMQREAAWAEFLLAGPTVTMDGDVLILTTESESVSLTDRVVAEPDASLTGAVWVLDGITVGDTVSSVPQGVTSSLEFTAEGVVSVQPGCNSGQGPYEVAGDRLRVGPLAVTKMACEGPPGEVENAVLAILDGELDFRVEGATLTIMRGDSGLFYRVD